MLPNILLHCKQNILYSSIAVKMQSTKQHFPKKELHQLLGETGIIKRCQSKFHKNKSLSKIWIPQYYSQVFVWRHLILQRDDCVEPVLLAYNGKGLNGYKTFHSGLVSVIFLIQWMIFWSLFAYCFVSFSVCMKKCLINTLAEKKKKCNRSNQFGEEGLQRSILATF